MASAITPLKWSAVVGLLLLVGVVLGLFVSKLLETPAAPEQGARSGRVIADFTLPDVHGRSVRLSEYVSGRPFVISFGTTTCPYCVMQVAAFKELQQRYGQQVAFLEINVGEPVARVADHVARLQSPITTLVDMDARVYRLYGSDAVPVTIVADAKRRILDVGNYMPPAQLAQKLGLTGAERTASMR